jgi:GNAT superfamily N-acetyltransferase
MSDAFTDQQLRVRAQDGFIRLLALFASGHPRSSLIRLPGFVHGCSVPQAPRRPLLNAACFDDAGAVVAQLPELTRAYQREGVAAWTLWVYPGQLNDALEHALAQQAMRPGPAQTLMGIEIDDLLGAPGPLPEGYAIDHNPSWDELAKVNELAYEFPKGEYDGVMSAAVAGGPNHLVVARDPEGNAVASGFFVIDGDNTPIGWIATALQAQRLGLASAVMRAGLGAARAAGAVTATLEATADGLPVYAKLGFRDLGVIETWQHGG